MSGKKFEIRISAFKLFFAALILITPICLVALLGLTRADQSVRSSVGSQFKTIAEISSSEVSRFIHDRVTDVGIMAMDFAVTTAVKSANSAYTGKDDQAVEKSIQEIERIWTTPAAEPMAQRILGSDASRLLRKHRDFDKRFLRVTVTDAKGGTVAATDKTVDYYQADEEFWQDIYAGGRGSVSVTDVLYDAVSKSHYIGVGVPILEEGTERFLGAVDALVDVSAIFPVQSMQFGTTARLMLVKDDGTVISAPGVNLSMNVKSEELAAIRDALTTISGRQTGYLVANLAAGQQIIGFADSGLKADYGKLGWLVLAAQSTEEAFAPVRTVDRLLALMALLGLAAVTLFGVYIALHREPAYSHLAEDPPEPVRGRSANA